MTAVEFHTGIDDPLAFACRLLGKAYRSGARVLVTAPAARLAALDQALWSFDDREFLPHVRLPAAEATLRRTPLWLALAVEAARGPWAAADLVAPSIVVNLDGGAPEQLDGVSRLIEIVGADDAERDAGRRRWRDYSERGLVPQLLSKAG
jgi:DNA polymerase III subunit chi